MIRQEGGVAVLAHPYSLDPSLRSTRPLLTDLVAAGLGGGEIYYPSHDSKTVKTLVKISKDLGLLMTGGSDFHDSERAGYKFHEWVQKTHLPYDFVTALKNYGSLNSRTEG